MTCISVRHAHLMKLFSSVRAELGDVRERCIGYLAKLLAMILYMIH